MKRMLLNVGFALPVYVVLQAALGGDIEWYEVLSATILSSMISGAWLKYMTNNAV